MFLEETTITFKDKREKPVVLLHRKSSSRNMNVKPYIFNICFLGIHKVGVWCPDLFNVISTECEIPILTLSKSDIWPNLKEV